MADAAELPGAAEDEPAWWLGAERQRHAWDERLRRDGRRRLRQIEAAARNPRAPAGAPAIEPLSIPDGSRDAAAWSQRLGARGMVRLLLWGASAAALAAALESFFSAPLMEPGTAAAGIIVAAMLAASYLL